MYSGPWHSSSAPFSQHGTPGCPPHLRLHITDCQHKHEGLRGQWTCSARSAYAALNIPQAPCPHVCACLHASHSACVAHFTRWPLAERTQPKTRHSRKAQLAVLNLRRSFRPAFTSAMGSSATSLRGTGWRGWGWWWVGCSSSHPQHNAHSSSNQAHLIRAVSLPKPNALCVKLQQG